MSAQLMLVNPRRRTKKRRTAAQKAATRKMIAANRRGKRRRNPAPPGAVLKRKRRRTSVISNPRRRRRTQRRSARQFFTQSNMTDFAFAATVGASGAIALDVALGFMPLPAMFKVGIPGKIAKGVAAIAMGAVANMSGLVRTSTARDMTVGALTVQFVGIGRELLAQFAPGVALSAYMNEDYAVSGNLGYAGSGWNPSSALNWANNGMGAYNVGEGYDIAAPGDGQPGLDEYHNSEFGW